MRAAAGARRRLRGSLAALPLLCLPPLRVVGQVPASAPARIEGTISVTIDASRLKHWGVPGAEAAWVPDGDRTGFAARIRSASSAQAVCSALSAARGRDPRISSTSVDGDASLDHRSGDEELMSFALTVPDASRDARGVLYVCSHPVFAMMSTGDYPREGFYQVAGERTLWWTSDRLSLRPGASVPVRLTESLDASDW